MTLLDRARKLYQERLELLPPESPYRARIEELVSWEHWLGTLWPDAQRYLVAHEQGAPRPYHYRWLAPWVCRGDRRRWTAVAYGSMIGMVPAMRLLTGRWVPGLFVFGLPGIWTTHRRCPPLVDAPAMFLAVLAAAATRRRRWVSAVILSLLAGATKETAPVFAALYAGNLLPLVGLAAPAVRHRQEPGPDITDDFSHYVLEHPWETGWLGHRGRSQDWRYWLSPWGGCLLGLTGDTRTVLTVAAAYGQCAVGWDGSRLYQWAWPVLADNATARAGDWWPLVLAAHAFNPWRGEGN